MKKYTSRLVKEVKRKIMELKTHKNLTEKELAEKIGTSQQHINKILNHNKDITLNQMEKFANAYDINVKDLLPVSLIQNNNENQNINDIKTIEKVSDALQENLKILTEIIQKNNLE
jgi:transcriptional regulator with XRE-family HTH domain